MSPLSRFVACFCLAQLAVPSFATDPIDNTDSADIFHADGILVGQADDGTFRWWLDGRVFLDAAAHSEGVNPLADGAELRAVRLAFKSIL